MMTTYIWFFAIAVVFTLVGYSWGIRKQIHNITRHTIDSLMKQGYLKYRKNSAGGVEILKHDQAD